MKIITGLILRSAFVFAQLTYAGASGAETFNSMVTAPVAGELEKNTANGEIGRAHV